MLSYPESPELFRIGTIPVLGPAALAPMDGFSDQPFRQLTRGLGSSLTISEFINAIDIQQGHRFLKNRLSFSEAERPFGYQILDNDVDRLLKGAHFLEALRPDFLDLNLGCPSKQVTHRGAGSALLSAPRRIEEMIIRLVKEIKIPVTAKIRLGWDDSNRNYLEICDILESNGCSMISVHARTKMQAYRGAAAWETIRQIKSRSRIPILGNGDIWLVEDIQAMMNETGCDGVLIGRAAVQNPWIFSGKNHHDTTKGEVLSFYQALFDRHCDFYGTKIAPKIFRKYVVRLMLNYPSMARDEKISILKSIDVLHIKSELERIILKYHV